MTSKTRHQTLLFTLLTSVALLSTQAQKFERTLQGLSGSTQSLEVHIQFYSPQMVRVLKYPVGSRPKDEHHVVIKEPEKTSISYREKGELITLKSAKLQLILNTSTGGIRFYDLNGNKLLTDKDYGTQFTPSEDGGNPSYTVRQAFLLNQDEAIYGLGQFQEGKMIQRHQKLHLLQEILTTAIPFFQSVKGYGVYWDNYSPTDFTDNPQETAFESATGDKADYYFLYGANADGVIAQMRDLTGQAPMFPYWTFGYWQSKERYQSQFETVGVVKKYRELGVPIDGIIQDWQYWGDNYHWNAMEFGNPNFPAPQSMVDSIHALNAHTIISIWSSFGPQTKQYQELNDQGMLYDFITWPKTDKNVWPQPADAKKSGVKVYDAYHPKARDIYWKHLHDGLYQYGFDGWWMDSTEPDHFDRKPEDYDQKTYLGTFRKVRNLYPLKSVGGVYEHQRAIDSLKRVFILTRSAFAGQQRYGANSWSGDVVAEWPVLKNQISAGLNFSLCGIPYWNSDIGGFFVWRHPNRVKNPNYKELYVRWLQFGTFCPMMRSHGTDTPREIYQFGNRGSWAFDAIEKYINLRYRLLPYIYSTAWEVTSQSSSMMRALMMDFANDPEALDINDQYMFGKSLLVSPVTESMYTENSEKILPADFSTIKSRRLYLPAGSDWLDFWTGETVKGGQYIERPVPIDIIPLYVKSGSIIPMGPEVQYANEKYDPIEISVYPGANGSFTLYEDERDNYNYEKGIFSTIQFNWDDKKKLLTIGDRQGHYPGMNKTRTFNVVLVKVNSGTGIATKPEEMKSVTYTGEKIVIDLK